MDQPQPDTRQPKESRTATLARIKRQRTRRLARLLAKAYYLQQRGRQEAMYNMVCEEFVSLGGVYVKFLQGVLLNSTVMKRWHSPDKLKIFEDLDTIPLDIVGILRTELTPAKLADIRLIQPKPFAAGSFGQVYYGQHVDGTPIIVKVLRPDIRELLRYDLRLLAIFSRNFANKQYQNIDMNVGNAMREFRASTLRETDYIAEAQFGQELYAAYRDHPKLVIPRTYVDLSTSHIIVQEYIDGISGAQLVKLKTEGTDPNDYVREKLGSDLDDQLKTLGVESIAGAFYLPRIQGDPHPGNLRFMTDNRIALIDFGISASSPTNKAAFYGVISEWSKLFNGNENMVGFFEQFMRFFINDLYMALQKLSGNRLSDENIDLTREVGRVMHEVFKSAIGTEDMKGILTGGRTLQTINKVINKGNRFGLVMRLDSSEILRASQTYMSVVETLGRRNDVLPVVFDTVVERLRNDSAESFQDGEEPISTSEAIETINRWLERVATRDPALFRQLIRRIKLQSDTKLKTAIDVKE
jgi:tRNA A-37 threonylcarbamoyl transferase component Bud32